MAMVETSPPQAAVDPVEFHDVFFFFLSYLVFKTIINSYSYYDFNLICRLWESIVFCKKIKKKLKNQ